MSDYLWDKSGEVDPEVEHLENLLGTLRYQPRPFELPAQSETPMRAPRTYWPRLAVAAALAFLLLASGLWFGLQSDDLSKTESPVAGNNGPGTKQKEQQIRESNRGMNAVEQASGGPPAVPPSVEKPPTNMARRAFPPKRRANDSSPNLSRAASPKELITMAQKRQLFKQQEKFEAERAKEQLLLALQVTGAELRLAQVKIRETTDVRSALENYYHAR